MAFGGLGIGVRDFIESYGTPLDSLGDNVRGLRKIVLSDRARLGYLSLSHRRAKDEAQDFIEFCRRHIKRLASEQPYALTDGTVSCFGFCTQVAFTGEFAAVDFTYYYEARLLRVVDVRPVDSGGSGGGGLVVTLGGLDTVADYTNAVWACEREDELRPAAAARLGASWDLLSPEDRRLLEGDGDDPILVDDGTSPARESHDLHTPRAMLVSPFGELDARRRRLFVSYVHRHAANDPIADMVRNSLRRSDTFDTMSIAYRIDRAGRRHCHGFGLFGHIGDSSRRVAMLSVSAPDNGVRQTYGVLLTSLAAGSVEHDTKSVSGLTVIVADRPDRALLSVPPRRGRRPGMRVMREVGGVTLEPMDRRLAARLSELMGGRGFNAFEVDGRSLHAMADAYRRVSTSASSYWTYDIGGDAVPPLYLDISKLKVTINIVGLSGVEDDSSGV